jgi:disulfide bond formation protein DsbB
MIGRLAPYWPGLIACGQVTAIAATLLGSLGYQFIMGELPCPLCVLQRIAFLLACVGPLGILLAPEGEKRRLTLFARGFGLCILASLVGASVAIRQILLHIVPPDPGYGPPVLGLHLYTWALIVFACLIASSACGLLALPDFPRPIPQWASKTLAGFIATIAAIIALATFAMAGFALLLPDDPQHYEIFHPFFERDHPHPEISR